MEALGWLKAPCVNDGKGKGAGGGNGSGREHTELSFALPGVANKVTAWNAKSNFRMNFSRTVEAFGCLLSSVDTIHATRSSVRASHLRCLNVLTYPLALCDCINKIFLFMASQHVRPVGVFRALRSAPLNKFCFNCCSVGMVTVAAAVSSLHATRSSPPKSRLCFSPAVLPPSAPCVQ